MTRHGRSGARNDEMIEDVARLWWAETPDAVAELSEQQAKILGVAAKYAKSDGAIVYAVCTVSPRENEGVIEKFLEENPAYRVEPVSKAFPPAKEFETPDGFARLMPHTTGTDGFFIARLVRNAK